jgi:hypothetical protein
MGVHAVRKLHVTEVGRQVAFSGLRPDTAHYLLDYLGSRHAELCSFVPDGAQRPGSPQRLNYCLINACLTSPEFWGAHRARSIPYGFDALVQNDPVVAYASSLAETQWQGYREAANATMLLMDWLEGVPLNLLEGQFPNVRAGNIRSLCRDLAWALSGVSNVLAAATQPNLSTEERPSCLRALSPDEVKSLRRLLQPLRILVWRLNVGLPPTVLWMTELKTANGERAVSRAEALSLHQIGLGSFESLRRWSNWEHLVEILGANGATDPHARARELQQLANGWHGTTRDRAKAQQLRRLDTADQPLLENFYQSRDKHFEAAFQALLERVGIRYTLFDTGKKPGAFDYLLHVEGRPDIAVECKTKQGDGLVDLAAARVVLSSSEQYGHRETFCVTLCQPGVDPNVPENLQACTRLCIVETHDLAEAFTRLIRQSLSPQSFHDWLAQPGQARAETLLVHTRAVTEPEVISPQPT